MFFSWRWRFCGPGLNFLLTWVQWEKALERGRLWLLDTPPPRVWPVASDAWNQAFSVLCQPGGREAVCETQTTLTPFLSLQCAVLATLSRWGVSACSMRKKWIWCAEERSASCSVLSGRQKLPSFVSMVCVLFSAQNCLMTQRRSAKIQRCPVKQASSFYSQLEKNKHIPAPLTMIHGGTWICLPESHSWHLLLLDFVSLLFFVVPKAHTEGRTLGWSKVLL